MKKRQLTERQARRELAGIQRLIDTYGFSKTNESYYRDDGTYVLYTKGMRLGYAHKFAPVASSVEDKCSDCSRVVVYRRSNAVPHICKMWFATREDLIKRNYTELILCLGCSNKRRAYAKAIQEHDETRRLINRAKAILTANKKEELQ